MAAAAAATAFAACGRSRPAAPTVGGVGDAAVFPAPSDPMARASQAGLVPNSHETLQHHVHAHLDVYVNGQHVLVPAGLGIDTTNPAVHRFTILGQPGWGGISRPCDQACISPLHTHDVSGILHTESPTSADNTLGELFTEWGVRLTADCVGTFCGPATPVSVYVNGRRVAGDPAALPLTNHEELTVIVGRPPTHIPTTGDFSQA